MALQDLTPQLRTRLRRVEKLVGLFVAVATLVLIAGFAYYLYHTAVRKGWFVEKCPYYTYVRSADGLKEGDPVMLMGFSVGEITVIEAQPPESWYPVFVGFDVRRPYYGYIWSDSEVKIAPAGLLGQRRIEITKGYAGSPTVVEENGRVSKILVGKELVPLAEAPKGVYMEPKEDPTLTERAEKLVAQVEQALPSFLGLTNQLQSVLNRTAQLTANLDHMVAQAQPIVTNLAEITTNLRDPQGSLGEWLIPEDIQTQLTNSLSTLTLSLNETLLNLASITSNLNLQVQSNDQILSDLSSLIVDTDELVQGLKRHWLLKGAFEKDEEKPQPILEPEIKPNDE